LQRHDEMLEAIPRADGGVAEHLRRMLHSFDHRTPAGAFHPPANPAQPLQRSLAIARFLCSFDRS
jgi:hypothetical protein